MTNHRSALSRTRLHVLIPALAGSLFAYSAALAQSTATQATEVVVTGKRAARSTDGLATQVQEAKDESIVNQTFFKTQVGSENFAQLINMLPGVTYSSEDPTGITSGDLRIHGIDGAHLGVTIDGDPVNDTGNYAIYPGEYLPAELTDHINVNIGATSVDSPTASAVGGTVDIVSKKPSVTPQTTLKLTGGDYDYFRAYGEVDPGAIGPTGATSYIGVNYDHAEKWKGAGDLLREGVDGKVYQPLGGRDFISVAADYIYEAPIFYYSGSRAQLAQYGDNFDYNTTWVAPTVTPGKADGVPANGGQAGSDTNFYEIHPNPVQFGQVRGASLFDLGHGLAFTFDPSFFYTLANGGGATALSECDPRLKGSTGHCVDLNGDGDTLDTVAVYSPSNTETHRYGVSTSLLWALNEDNQLQLAYTWDYGHHRQTGQMTTIDQQNGDPSNIFGAETGYGRPILASDGAMLRSRDRLSVAILNQASVNYVGKFLDDRLHVNIGVRDPMFQRDLNQYCYTYNGSSAYCTSANEAAILAAYAADVGTGKTTNLSAYIPGVRYNPLTGAPNFRAPFKQTFHFEKVLPNAGVCYRFDENDSVYATFAEGFSAPKTDDLYTSSPELVKPESSNEYGVGYRFQSHTVTVSSNFWYTDYQNRIVSSVDPADATLTIDRNVGAVKIYGWDLEGGWKATDHLSFYGSADLQKSRLEANYLVPVGAVSAPLPVKGKTLVMSPDQQASLRAQYDIDGFSFGLDGKYTGRRFISDTNDDHIGDFTVVDLDAKYELPIGATKTSIQLNVDNLFDRRYISRVSTVSTSYAVASVPGYAPGTPFFYVGAPRTFYVTLQAVF